MSSLIQKIKGNIFLTRVFFKSTGSLVLVLFFLFTSCSIEVDHIPIDSIQEHVNLIKNYQEKGKNEDLFESYEKLLEDNPDIGDDPFIYYYLSLVEKDNHYFKEGLKKFPKDPELNYRRISSTSKDSIPIILKNILNENPTHLPSFKSLLKSDIYEFIHDTESDSSMVLKHRREVEELSKTINRYIWNFRNSNSSDSIYNFLSSGFFKDLYSKLDRIVSIINSNPSGIYYRESRDCYKKRCIQYESYVEVYDNGTWDSKLFQDGRLVKNLTGKWFMKKVPQNKFRNPYSYNLVVFSNDTKGLYSIKRRFSVYSYRDGEFDLFDGEGLMNKLNPFYGVEKVIKTKVIRNENYLSNLYETYKTYINKELVFDKDELIKGILTTDVRSVLDLQKLEFTTEDFPFLELPLFRRVIKKDNQIYLNQDYLKKDR